ILVFSLFGGALADAVDRRRLLLVTDFGMAVTSALLAVNAALGHPRVWAIYALAVVAAAFLSIGRPPLHAAFPRLVPLDQVPAVGSLDALGATFAAIVGPAVGGALITAVGLPATYSIDVLTFAVSLVAVWFLAPMPSAHDADRPGIAAILDG